MLIFYHNSSDERLLRIHSNVMFREVSSGVYHVVKDRFSLYPSFVNSEKVISALNKKEKVAITGKSGMYANFEVI